MIRARCGFASVVSKSRTTHSGWRRMSVASRTARLCSVCRCLLLALVDIIQPSIHRRDNPVPDSLGIGDDVNNRRVLLAQRDKQVVNPAQPLDNHFAATFAAESFGFLLMTGGQRAHARDARPPNLVRSFSTHPAS